eukprot:51809_1
MAEQIKHVHQQDSTISHSHNKELNQWKLIKITSSIIFDDVNIGNCIYNTFVNNNWVHKDDILDNLIEFKQNNIVSMIVDNIYKNSITSNKWDKERDNDILYRLLLTIYKDNKINIKDILSEFIATITPAADVINFSDCN